MPEYFPAYFYNQQVCYATVVNKNSILENYPFPDR